MSKDKYINNYSKYLGARRCCDINGVGPKGYDGIKGPVGDIGLQGNTGNTGATGFTGIMGKSCRGPTGPIGPSNGPIGSTGYTGPYASFAQGIGININEDTSNNYSIELESSGNNVSYNIYPNYYYNIAINTYGRTNIQFNPIQIVTDLIPVSFTDYLGQNYRVYDFLSNNSFNCTSGGIVSMLLIGGGGGGSSGYKCGGAGAGEVLFIDNYYLVEGSYNIVIGQGGEGGIGGQGGHDGSSTYIITSDNSFNAVGGAGAVFGSNTGKNGLPGILPPNPTLSIGTSSGSGGGGTDTASSNSGGLGYSVTYLSGITPYVNTSPNMWSYANNGGNGGNINIYGGGGGGGSGGSGGNSTDSSCGSPGLGLYINYYTDTDTEIKPGYVAGGSGLPNTSIYGAGQCYSNSNVNASSNTGSGGGSNPLTSGGRGGSGRLIDRKRHV